MNNLDLLSKKPMTWIYGEYMCHYIPVGQVLGNLTSSVALLVIALDRYHNVIHALSKKWNPALWKCLCGALFVWVICTGLSYPVVTFYIYMLIVLDGKDTAMCTGGPQTKSTIFTYYLCMTCLFFLPIVIMFIWFYYKIAYLIWQHRKPPSEQEITETSCTTKIQEVKKKNVHMERKIRSFKIVVTLIIAFIGCRFPYWLIMLYQQVNVVDRNVLWNIRFSCIALYLLNCALNPLLYTFLNVTIVMFRKVNAFLTNTCCCWFSNSDFEEYETGKPLSTGILGVDKITGAAKNDKLNDVRVKVHVIDVPDVPKYRQRKIY